SIAWAREMRGRNSIAKASTPCPASLIGVSLSVYGASSAASTAPFFICAIVPASGARTERTRSAPASAAAASGTMVAPAAWYSASAIRAADPAPASTATSRPSPLSFLTVSGVAATLVSPSRRSLRTASFTGALAGPEDRQEDHDQADTDDRPFHE